MRLLALLTGVILPLFGATAAAAAPIGCDLSGRWSGHWPANYHGGAQPGEPSSVVAITPGAGGGATGEYIAYVAHWKPPHQPLRLYSNGSVMLGAGAIRGSVRALNASVGACTFIVIEGGGPESWCLSPLCPIADGPRPPSPPSPPQSPPTEPWPALHGYTADALPARNSSLDPLVRYAWNSSIDPSVMQTFLMQPARIVGAEPAAAFEGLDTILTTTPNVTIKPGGTLCLDFGLETAGWIEFQSPDLGQAGAAAVRSVTTGMGEYNAPDKLKHGPVQMAGSGDTFVTCYEACGSAENYEGVRFVWIMLAADAAGPLTLTNITVVAQVRPVSYAGSFSSSNQMLEKIYYAGAYGTRVNMHPATLGSILYDRGDRKAFQGDNMVASAVAEAVFGSQAFPLVLANIKSTNSGSIKTGIKKDYAGHGESGVHDANLVPYPLYWTQTVCDYVWASNDTESLVNFSPNIAQILTSHAATATSQWLNVELNFYGWDDRVRVGAGEKGYGVLGPYASLEPQLAYVSLLIQSCRYFAHTLNATNGDVELAANMSNIAEMLTAKVRAQPSSDGGAYWKDYGVHASANLLSAGVPTAAERHLIAANVFNDSTAVCSYSPFNTYYILKGMTYLPNGVRYGNAAAELCWSNMVKNGRGCFWENDDPMWGRFMADGDKPPGNPSLCHPWSSGVTQWLSQNTLGVTALQPGYKSWVAAPFVSEDLHTVSGRFPAASGPIDVDATWKLGGEVSVTVTAPTPGRIAVLRTHTSAGGALIGATVNGIEVDAGGSDDLLTPPFGDVSQVEERWYTELLPPGRHTVVARYATVDSTTYPSVSSGSGSTYAPFPPPIFPVKSNNDTKTGGTNWYTKYGQDGYALFGFDGGKDRTKLPSYVTNITFSLGGGSGNVAGLNCSGANNPCLQDPTDPSKRSLGGGGGQILDINSTLGTRYKLAIYCVGTFDKGQNDLLGVPPHQPALALRVLDLSPGSGHLNPASETIHVHNFEGGVWWVLGADRPLRFRILSQYGSGVINALAFSPL